jgi:hypothetical protein
MASGRDSLILAEEEIREAIFSEDGLFRYTLWRHLTPELLPFEAPPIPDREYVQFIGLNPSTADNVKNDRTISKLMKLAGWWGYQWMLMTNLFAYRTKEPKEMKKHLGAKSPIGIDNFRHVVEKAKRAHMVVCCWGNDGAHLNQSGVMRAALAAAKVDLKCFKITATGEPQHPLYLKNETALIPFRT